MKKLMTVFIVLLSLFVIPNFKVEALEDSFHAAEYIPGAYIKKFKGSSGKYEQLRFFRRNSDNEPVYCLEPWENLKENTNLTRYDSKPYQQASLDYATWEKVMLIAYYGYGYDGHMDSKWFAITQFMIWKEVSKDSTFYFTDTLNGNQVTKYEEEMEEIQSLIKAHGITPSFYNEHYDLTYNTPITITDTNQVLDRFDYHHNGTIEVQKEGNQLTVTKKTKGETILYFTNSGKRFTSDPIIYVDQTGQDVLAPGNYYPIYMVITLNVNPAKIIVNKLDMTTGTTESLGEASLKGSKFQLLDQDNYFVAEKEIGEDFTLSFDDLDYGTYYLKEIQAGTGYELNPNTLEIEVNEEVKNVSFYNQVIQNQITFQKYLKNPITGEIKEEKDAKFSIYDKNHRKVTTFKTDENGTYSLTLPYGTYTVVQEEGAKNHAFVEDFEIHVVEANQIQNFPLYNEELTLNIRIQNIDFDSHLPILEKGAVFRIKDLETGKYVTDFNGNILLLSTNNFGVTNLYLLSSGVYQVEQIQAVDTYRMNQHVFFFQINEDTIYQEDENQQKYIEIIVPNQKIRSRIEFEKWTEYYFNDILTNKIQDKEITIPIYAKEDVYSKDGLKLYAKDSLVSIAKWNGKMILTEDLYLGTFYFTNPINHSRMEVTLDSEEPKKIDLLEQIYEYSKEIEVYIQVKNTDFDSHLPILEKGASFRIKNRETGEYLKDEKGNTFILTTNNLGITTMYLLTSGTYQVEQIKAVDGYVMNENIFLFEINDNTNYLEDENHQKYMEIIVPNQKIKSRIEIEKWMEYYFNDILKDKKQDIEIEIPIYAKEDIYSKDGVKLYAKDSLVSTAKWNGKTILTDDLYLGSYYLIDPTNESVIEVLLDSLETKKVELLEQVFEYSDEQERIEVPNTEIHQSNISYFGTFLLLSGFYLLRKEKKNEN